jgi:penicillin-binding protein 1C
MPPARQRVPLTARHAPDNARLYLDGKPVPTQWWFPLPGKHRLELKSAEGAVLDAVRFEVRGATLNTDTRRPTVNHPAAN